MMGPEGGLLVVCRFNINLPVPAVSIQCGNHHAFPKGGNALVHAWYGVGIQFIYCIQLLIVDTNA